MLLHDRATTAGSVLGVVAIVFLVGQQLATLSGLVSYMSVLVDRSGADIWITSKDTDNINSAGDLPIKYIDRLLALDDIEWAEPLVTAGGLLRRKDGKFQPVRVVGVARPRMAGGPWQFEQGDVGVLLDVDAVTVDRLDLETLGNPEVGDVLEISGVRVQVAGITDGIQGFAGTLVFAGEEKAREVGRVPDDRCSNILIRLRQGVDPKQALARIRRVLPGAEAYTASELAANTKLYYLTETGIGFSFGFTTFAGIMVGVVIIVLTMYTTVLNRVRDFAVLRALGARKKDIRAIVLFQAIVIGLVGILIGFFLLAGFLFGTAGSQLPSQMPLWIPPIHALFTLLLCVAGSGLAIRRATKVEPASAFR
jgi:putative ABC transport system permease protein